MIAPDKIPFAIIGTVIVKNALSLEEPSEIAASSIDIGICCNVATEDRIVYGIRLITKAIIMIATVPVKASGFEENDIANAIPTTEPGMI